MKRVQSISSHPTPHFSSPERLLVPQRVPVRGRGNKGKMRFQDAFCGAYFTFAVTQEGHIYGFGLSNYHQLGEFAWSLQICCLLGGFGGNPELLEPTVCSQRPV